MVIHFLEFHNFLAFHGTHRLELLTERNAAQPFCLILAPTNSGKTTTIRALRYLLYGRLDDTPLSIHHNLISHKEKLSCRTGNKAQASVSAKIRFGDREPITIRRRVAAARTGEGIEAFSDRELEFEALELLTHGNKWRDCREELNKLVEKFAPSLLFNLFVFSGEPGEGRIDPTTTDARLIDDLHSIFRIRAWSEAENQVRSMIASLKADTSKMDSAGLKVNLALQKYEEAKALVEKTKSEIFDAESDANLKKDQSLQLTIKLNNLAPLTTRAAELEREINEAEKVVKTARNTVESSKDRLRELFARSRGWPWLGNELAWMKDWIPAQLQEEPSVPRDLVDWLLKKRKSCICGTELRLKSPERAEVEKWKDQGGKSTSNRGLRDLAEDLISGDSDGPKVISGAIRREMRSALENFDENEPKIGDLQLKISQLEAERNRIDDAAAKDLRVKLTKLNSERDALLQKVGNLTARLPGYERSVVSTRDEYAIAKRALRTGDKDELQKREQRSFRLTALLELLVSSRQTLKNQLVAGLQQRLSDHYDSAASDGSKAKVSSSLTPRIERNGVPMSAIGGGQKLMLELGYVVAVAELYNEICRSLKDLGLALQASGETSIFADAAFSNAADTYNQRIVEFLAASNSSQVVLLMHTTQWNSVKTWVEPLVHRCFGYRLHSPQPPKQRTEYRAIVQGHDLTLIQELPANAESYTEILNIF